MTLKSYDGTAVVVEDKILTLVCKVKGSQFTTFKWYKDGAVVDVWRTQRNVWETEIPSEDGETRISELNINKVHPLDAGKQHRQSTPTRCR